jgi:protein-tyrosine-phosphatase
MERRVAIEQALAHLPLMLTVEQTCQVLGIGRSQPPPATGATFMIECFGRRDLEPGFGTPLLRPGRLLPDLRHISLNVESIIVENYGQCMSLDLATRAGVFAALGEPARLAICDELAVSDRSPSELGRRVGLESNLLAHHLDVLEAAGLVVRSSSHSDGRRRYARLVHSRIDQLSGLVGERRLAARSALFVCTHNSARSPLAAVVWSHITGAPAESAGTHPVDRVHPGAVAAALRAGLDVSAARPRLLDAVRRRPQLVVTVCDRAHEELDPQPGWLHWSLPDPVEDGRPAAFDAVVAELRDRIATLTRTAA